ncbi:hypothetical protein HPB52_020505 [Rhipicephalus sanguineus]|uniref:Uncharacterized protein n=1 Tax=Rhipicephalus sanguineus TaxID=34632 RepID=A0A9D4Q2E3_RHISA|nr:hypothetical protein HPB52_020505 [Rhipicephalus sanguineus]
MNSLTPTRRAAYVEQLKKLSPTFYRTARACTISPAPHQVCRNSWACRAKQKKPISIGSITPRISCYAGTVLTEGSQPHRPGKHPNTLFSGPAHRHSAALFQWVKAD